MIQSNKVVHFGMYTFVIEAFDHERLQLRLLILCPQPICS